MQPFVPLNLFRNDVLIPIPPSKEQKRINNEVERWFTLIDELENNEGDLLKAIDKAKSKILDLAIHGKLVPQDPNDEPAIDLLKRINPQFETCSDSLYETLPNGWEVCIMNDIASSELGKTLDKEKNKGEYKPYLCSINVFWNHFVLNEMKQMRFEINELEHYSIHQGDLVICEGGDAGRCAVWPNSYSVLFQNAIHRVRFKENIDSYFYMYVIMYLKNKHILDNYCKGVTIKHFTKTALLSLPVPLPPINEQLRIVAKIEELFAVLDSIKESLEV
jgi:type I restriction enzyme S subunit